MKYKIITKDKKEYLVDDWDWAMGSGVGSALLYGYKGFVNGKRTIFVSHDNLSVIETLEV